MPELLDDVFCKERVEMSDEKNALILSIKEKAEELLTLFYKHLDELPDVTSSMCREASVAKERLEDAVMWAVKGVVKN